MFYRSILKELENWRVSPFRKPLIIRGARQVGKTTVVNTFGQQFEQYIYLNLEKKSDRDLFDENLDINEIVDRIFIIKGMKRSFIQSTLLFIDEIQEAVFVVNLLRYFKEEVSELPVIAAGSMLETLLGKNITFPVGRKCFRTGRYIRAIKYRSA
jgi:predicted AAA+ superfamily ATPase